MTPHVFRQHVRTGEFTGHTSGVCDGFLQANILIVPSRVASDFHRYCTSNPRPCPLVSVSKLGEPSLPELGKYIDIRTDLPGYRIFADGNVAEASDIADVWRDDLVTFALGCSFTFERVLLNNGIHLWHVENGRNVAMYRTNMMTEPVGPFSGPMVVSMRPIGRDMIKKTIRICGDFPNAHGAPVHWGDPSAIGIDDLDAPEWGDTAPVAEGEVPVFWACGVTSQVSLEKADLDFCISHKPGCMLVTDVPEIGVQEMPQAHQKRAGA